MRRTAKNSEICRGWPWKQKEISLLWTDLNFAISSLESHTAIFPFKLDTTYRQYSWSNGFGSNRIEMDGNVLYCIQKGNKRLESWREYSPHQMVMTISCQGHTAKKYFIPTGVEDDTCCDDDRCCVTTTDQKVNLV